MKKLTLWAIDKDSSQGQQKTIAFSDAEELQQELEIFDDEIPYRKFYYELEDDEEDLTEKEKEILNEFGIIW